MNCSCKAVTAWDGYPTGGIEFCPLHSAAPELLETCKAQHDALDFLLALLVMKDASFLPSRSKVWPTVVNGNVVIAKAEGRS